MRDTGVGVGEVGCWDLRAGFRTSGMGRQLLIPRGKSRMTQPQIR